MKSRVVSRIIWFCVLAVLLYTVFFIWTDARRNLEVLKAFSWSTLPAILGLVMVNFVLREVKWDFFRRVAGIRVPRLGSFLVFFSGYSMAISPGRVGELIKPFMYKEYFGQNMRRSIPLVFCERISDLLGMILIALVSVTAYMNGLTLSMAKEADSALVTLIYIFLGISIAAMAAGIFVARQKRWVYAAIHWGMKRPRLRKSMKHLRHLYYATYPLLTVRNLIITSLLGAISWSFEVVAAKLIMAGVGAPDVSFLELAFVFCMATIVGGFLFFLPGGLGGFEGTAYKLLQMLGVGENAITPGILLIRFCTLFFAVGLGFFFILLTSLKYHKSLQWDEFEHASEESTEALDHEL
jgi:uncharacterized protein (TIRG00374 family)